MFVVEAKASMRKHHLKTQKNSALIKLPATSVESSTMRTPPDKSPSNVIKDLIDKQKQLFLIASKFLVHKWSLSNQYSKMHPKQLKHLKLYDAGDTLVLTLYPKTENVFKFFV